MRKLLLASAAMLGATAGLANAQTVSNPNQGQLVAPWAAGPSANNNNNAVGRATKGAIATPAPGTVVIRLNGRVQTSMQAIFTSVDSVVSGGNVFKVNPINFDSYLRLYPGVDGMAANGLRYGASAELRENFLNNQNGTTAGASQAALSPSGFSSTQSMFVRRAFTYLASDQVGIVRLGQTDGLIGLFDNGIFTNAGWDGGIGILNGGMMQSDGPQNAVGVPFVWLSQAGSEYSNNKIVYLTPQFFGFDFGVQYAPNMGNSFGNNGSTCAVAANSCVSASSGTDATRWLNQVGVGGRYQGKFGDVGVGAFAVYQTAGKESGPFTSITSLAPAARLGFAPGSVKYDNLSFVTGGVYVSYAGFTVAADYIGGAINGQLGMRPQGAPSMNAVTGGVTYTTGPLTVGVTAGVIDHQGDVRLTGISQRHEFEVAFGGNYKLAPGLALVAEYMYTQRHQGGFDFVTGARSLSGAGTRDAKAQGLLFGTVVTW